MIYLNNAATTYPKPREVIQAVHACMTSLPASQFRSFEDAQASSDDVLSCCRRELASLFGIPDSESERIYFTSGATESWNAIIGGLLEDGDVILTTQTEHNAVLRPLHNQFKKLHVCIAAADPEGHVDKASYEAHFKNNPGKIKAVFLNHCSNVTGAIQDLEYFGRIARQNNALFLVDGAQSAGCIPIHVETMHVDGLVFTGHKGLYGIQGTGGFYAGSRLSLRATRFGGTGIHSEWLQIPEGVIFHEVGTQNTPGIAGLLAGVRYVKNIGITTIQQQEQYLIQLLLDGLRSQKGVTVYAPERAEGPVVSWNVKGFRPQDAAYVLYHGYGITLRSGLHCAPLMMDVLQTGLDGCLRASVSTFTTEAHVQTLLSAIRDLTGAL